MVAVLHAAETARLQVSEKVSPRSILILLSTSRASASCFSAFHPQPLNGIEIQAQSLGWGNVHYELIFHGIRGKIPPPTLFEIVSKTESDLQLPGFVHIFVAYVKTWPCSQFAGGGAFLFLGV